MKCHCKKCTNVESTIKKSVNHVIFDLDGVIIDSENVYRQAFRETIEEYGHKFENTFYESISGTTSPSLADVTIAKYGLGILKDDFIQKYRGYSRKGMTDLNLIPGAERMIRHLYDNSIPIAIATSSAKESFLAKTKKFEELIRLFHHIVCGDDPEVKHGKPQPDIFLVCASRFENKPRPSECLVFEDSSNGVKGALAAGMQVVMIPNKTVSPEIWKLASLKIDAFDCMVPEMFGLPPFSETITSDDLE